MTAGCLLTGNFKGISYREMLYWMAYAKIERQQMEQQSLINSAKSNLTQYQRKI